MIIDYLMTRDYCSDWTVKNAIRDIAQNALDASDECEFLTGDSYLTILSCGDVLNLEHLGMGYSLKSTSDPIGKYGEGLKIALLVLTREGLNPEVRTGNNKITGVFKKSDTLLIETFHLCVEDTAVYCDGVLFNCDNPGDVSDEVTMFREEPLLKLSGSEVQVLANEPGRVYVSGLYVTTDKDLKHGYNFAPGALKLNRDRNMSEGVSDATSRYYADHAPIEDTFELIEAEAKDVQELSWMSIPKERSDELQRLITARHGEDLVIAQSYDSRPYASNVVRMSYSRYNTYRKLGFTQATTIDPNHPVAVLNKFMLTNKKRMRRDLRKSFKELIKLAEDKRWS